MHISSQFDSGNIEVVSAQSPDDIRLTIPNDNQSEFAQWFHFRLVGETFVTHTMTIGNLAKSAYPEGWKGYNVLASYDRQTWFRIPSEFDGDNLTFSLTLEQPSVYFAYFIPFSYERHLDLVHDAQMSLLCEHKFLGLTLDGRDMSMLVIGEETPEKKKVWITARQHPGETMAEWCAEGIIYRLLDEQDGLARQLLDNAVFYIVPNMNPDGSARGHLRTNAVGTNLNREWATPSKEKSPEVLYVLNAMSEIGVDMYLDLHGDEALPYNFVAGSEGNPSYNDTMPGKANLTVASNAVGEKFKCMAYTVEMPFKDNADVPDDIYGWSVQRSRQLGEDLLIGVNAVVKKLKASEQ